MNPLEEAGQSARTIEPCILVIFGATGDLTGRKLAPAIYNLGKDGLLPAKFACVGFARRDNTNEGFREELKQDIGEFSRTKPVDETYWNTFKEQIFYYRSEFDSDEGFQGLAGYLAELDSKLGTRGNRVFYLSVQPKYFAPIIEKLKKFNLIYDVHRETNKWSRVIIEKPFGHDYDSAKALQQDIENHLDETEIYRIDHYLGKETVQNLLVFRFGNSIFEALWNYRHIDHVQITVAEDIGIGTRGAFFEEEGLLRDVVQNHMMQLLSLVAMEPPVSLSATAIRDEKVKVLQSIRPFSKKDFDSSVFRGQYGPGFINGESAIGYRQEAKVSPSSSVETYVAFRMAIDNWRWAGVPFYLRAGKRLPKRVTEIAIVFKDAPGVLFPKGESNVLALRIQPNEGISLKINCKVPGPSSPIQPVKMDFLYSTYFGGQPPEAYERLIWDCMMGDSTLFARSDEVANSWKIFTPLLDYWAKKGAFLPQLRLRDLGPSGIRCDDRKRWTRLAEAMTQQIVTPAKIEDKLLSLWDKLAKTNKMRACLFNLIVYHTTSARTAYIRTIVQTIIDQFPCRVLFISYDPDPKKSYLKTAVSVVLPTKESSVACDHIDIGVAGLDWERVPSVILPHLIPDLPVSLLWSEDKAKSHPLFSSLAQIATRIIFDSECADHLLNFSKELTELNEERRKHIADLNWTRIEGWRNLLSSTFMSKERDLADLQSVKITYNAKPTESFCHLKIQSMYLYAFLASRLGRNFSCEIESIERDSVGPGSIVSLEMITKKKTQYLFTRSKETPFQITVRVTSTEACELPYQYILAKPFTGQSLLREIFFQGTSPFFLETLHQLPSLELKK